MTVAKVIMRARAGQPYLTSYIQEKVRALDASAHCGATLVLPHLNKGVAMLVSTLVSAFALARFVNGQLADTTPQCGQTCFSTKAGEAAELAPGVSSTDFYGLCSSERFIAAWNQCLQDNCGSQEDIEASQGAAAQVCEAASSAFSESSTVASVTSSASSAVASVESSLSSEAEAVSSSVASLISSAESAAASASSEAAQATATDAQASAESVASSASSVIASAQSAAEAALTSIAAGATSRIASATSAIAEATQAVGGSNAAGRLVPDGQLGSAAGAALVVVAAAFAL